MHVETIEPPQTLPHEFQLALGGLIEAVGRANFSETLFRVARSATGCEHLTVFTGACGQAPQTAIIEGLGTPSWLYESNKRYLKNHWHADPIRRLETDQESSSSSLVLIDPAELSDTAYRNDCFTSVKLHSRASVFRKRGGRRMQLNLYFSDLRAFNPTVTQYLSETAELTDALLQRHGVHCERNDHRLGRETIIARLRMAAPSLTERELQVCTHIARGLSSEGISLELGISLNTVLTYRKRAYARLQISSQNELLQLLVL
ncbi:DNA-binding CsgD family transcriptional regulator [Paraburkholderia sacchari]|uniref:helix-turn-helix transcriptional regulator n=1 Tax=Paraburkholderia sacchari TaxID=159450 RepID=UPI0039A6FE37